MQLLLSELSQTVAPDAHSILVLDKAGWHTAKRLKWPDNVSPIHLPPYSPELNGIERIWLNLKERYHSHCVLLTQTKSSTLAATPGTSSSQKRAVSRPWRLHLGPKRSILRGTGITVQISRDNRGLPSVFQNSDTPKVDIY